MKLELPSDRRKLGQVQRSPMRLPSEGWLTIVALCVVSLASCQAEPQQAKLAASAVVLEDGPSQDVYAGSIVRHPATSCNVVGGLPVVVPDGKPLIGQPYRAAWTLRPTVPPEPTYQFAVLVFSIDKPADPHEIEGAPGCMLMVHPDNITIPASGTYLTQSGGRVDLRITPPQSFLGRVFDLQLIVGDTRNNAGLVVSPMLRLHVGNR